MTEGRHGYVSDQERRLILDDVLETFAAQGWSIDDRTDVRACISKPWGPLYLLLLLSPELFKRRSVYVDREGALTVTRLPPRGNRVSAYRRD
jgi:hypothetical protein